MKLINNRFRPIFPYGNIYDGPFAGRTRRTVFVVYVVYAAQRSIGRRMFANNNNRVSGRTPRRGFRTRGGSTWYGISMKPFSEHVRLVRFRWSPNETVDHT